MRTVEVDQIIEQDTDRVLFGGTDQETGDRVTFHARGRKFTAVAQAVRAGHKVVTELNI